MEKSETRKRLESLAWRTGMMVFAFALDATVQQLSSFNLSPVLTIQIGLILGEVSKAIHNYLAEQN